MIRRILRLGLVGGVLGGASFLVARLVQSRRAASEVPPPSDWLPPRRSEKPLVEPEMLHGLSLRKNGDTGDDDLDDGDAGDDTADGATASDGAGAGEAAWVEPEGGACPASHPVKAKLSSGIFHLPGMLAYDRTTPDRCYRDPSAAEADGLRRAKR